MTRKRPALTKKPSRPSTPVPEAPLQLGIGNGGEDASDILTLADPHESTLDAPAPEEALLPSVIIEIDPAVSGGYVHNRFDIMIRGRAVSEAALEEIRLEIDGRVTSTAFYGQPERASSVVMPSGRPGRQRSFQFNLPRPSTMGVERVVFQIIARTTDGVEFRENFEIEVDSSAPEPVVVLSGPTKSVGAYGGGRPYAILYIERGSIDDDGVMSVTGWAVSLGPILAVQIYAGEERIAAAKMGAERDDVATVFSGYPNARLSGFNLTIQLDELDRDAAYIRGQVVCPNGFGQEESIPVERLARRAPQRAVQPPPGPALPPPATAAVPPAPQSFTLMNQQSLYQIKADFRLDDDPLLGLVLTPPPPAPALVAVAPPAPPPPPPPLPEPAVVEAPPQKEELSPEINMFCDAADLTGDGTLSLNGWATCAIGIAQVRILLDGNEVGLATFGHERPDVGRIFANIPMAHLSGFKFNQRIGAFFEGEHSVQVVVRNTLAGEKEHTVSTVATAVAAPAVVTPAEPPKPAAPAFEPTPEQAAEFKFELDAPALTNNAVPEPISGRLTIDGWLLTRSGIDSFEVFLDDQRLGDAHYGLARQDVGAAFPEWPNSLRSGYAFHCPPRSLRDGEHTVRLKIRAKSGQELSRQFQITVKKAEEQQDLTGIRRRVPRVESDMMLAFLAEMSYQPSYRYILRQDHSISIDHLQTTFDALRRQSYDEWDVVVLAADADVASAFGIVIEEAIPDLVDRFRVITPTDEAAWNAPLADAADGRDRLFSLLLPGDEPGADALMELAVAAGKHPQADMLYGDEVRVSPVSKEREPFFKPDFSPDLLLSMNYIGRPWVVSADLLHRIGTSPASLLADGEYDLVMRCAEAAGGIYHVPKLLCQRGIMDLDDPDAERAALERMLQRRGIAGVVLETPIPGTWRVKRTLMSKGKVSIIIPTCAANGYIETCITSLREKTAYKNYEIVVIDNIPQSEMAWKVWVKQHADKIVDIPAAFNWSIFNNRAVEISDGEYVLFLNDDITITDPNWLDVLLEHGQRPEVGITGPQLLYPDGKVQHAGMFLATNGIGRHAFRFAAHDEPCYFGLALTQRNVIAVTGACLLVRRETFERLGRFDEAHQIVNNDLDFCLRVHKAGLLTVFTPYTSLIHHELASRARMKDVFDLSHFNAAWKTTFAAGDPYFNPRLSRHADDYRPDDEPLQWVAPGSPLFHVAEIKRILVVKLDHIGDFVTALPPIRRLKTIFPQARITVLAGQASKAFVALEPAIDELIPFNFFHARSQLGERALTKEDFLALAAQLRPYRFDLAVDLRKHPSTRDVLQYTGARFLAGFDHLGQYPNLDIALDWDGDRTLQRKRSHIVDDLLGLVNAIGHATENDRVIMQPSPAPMPLTDLPETIQALFTKRVVAIHPGAGNITKQWPEEHFSALIDLLIERNDVNILLVGGPDEVAVATSLAENVLHTGSIGSLAGKTSLADLPRLLRNCSLYIGNDSGPKHIAAAVGIPTIGIHSGVVDPVEWGPIGANAVALRRNMTCSPCYLAKAEDCPRALACLRFLEPNLVYETADMMLKTALREVEAADATVQAPPVDAPKQGVGSAVSHVASKAKARRSQRAAATV